MPTFKMSNGTICSNETSNGTHNRTTGPVSCLSVECTFIQNLDCFLSTAGKKGDEGVLGRTQ